MLQLHLPRHQQGAFCLRTFSIAAAPCFLKSAASASRKSLLNDLRVASNAPPAFTRINLRFSRVLPRRGHPPPPSRLAPPPHARPGSPPLSTTMNSQPPRLQLCKKAYKLEPISKLLGGVDRL